MKKNTKTIIFAIVAAILLAILGRFLLLNIFTESPKKVAENYFSAVKKLDLSKSKSFLDNSEFTSSYIETAQEQDYFKTYINSLEIKKIDEIKDKNNKDKTTIKILIKKIDMQLIFEKYISEIYAKLFTNTEKSDEQIKQDSNEFFKSELNKPALKTIEKEYTLNLIKINNKWKIVNDDNLSKAILDVESTANTSSNESYNTENPTK